MANNFRALTLATYVVIENVFNAVKKLLKNTNAMNTFYQAVDNM